MFHEFLPLRSNLGVEVWMLHSQGTADPAEDAASFQQLGEIGYAWQRGAEALQILKSDPGAALDRSWRQFLKTWTGHEHPLRHLAQATWRAKVKTILFTGLSGLALWGLLALIARRDDARWPIACPLLVFPVVYYVAGSGLQYRLPIDPVVILLAAVPLAVFEQALRYRLCSWDRFAA
jgi:hypothetical protein